MICTNAMPCIQLEPLTRLCQGSTFALTLTPTLYALPPTACELVPIPLPLVLLPLAVLLLHPNQELL